MSAKWSLHVKGFGKIKEAEIATSPFLLFVGDNNSGKSYLMSLLWGVLAFGRKYFGVENGAYSISQLPSYKQCEEWVLQHLGERPSEFVVDESAERLFVSLFNEAVDRYKDELVRQIIQHPVSIQHLSINNFTRTHPLKILINVNKPLLEGTEAEEIERVTVAFHSNQVVYNPNSYETMFKYLPSVILSTTWHLLMDGVQASRSIFSNIYEPLFLPASRTGFMLTYKKLLQDITEFGTDGESDNSAKTLMPHTVVRFLQKLIGLEFDNSAGGAPNEEVANYLENNVLNGKFKKDTSPVPNYLFVPEGNEQQIPLHATSSLVTEISPLLLMLRSQYRFGLLIIEEPEAHLHPNVQRHFVKAIAKLVNAGLPIWITTHSDTIIQQVNNLICLRSLCERVEDPVSLAEFGYELDETLEYKDVQMYQFSSQSAVESQVMTLLTQPDGVSVPTFNESIIALQREVLKIQDELAAAMEQSQEPFSQGV